MADVADDSATTNGASATTNGAPATTNGAPAPLTSEQKELIKKTWALVVPDLQGAGLILFNK